MDATLDMDGGWKEAITNVSDLDRWCDLAERVCGWTIAHRGAVDSRVLANWRQTLGVKRRCSIVVTKPKGLCAS
jgi:hypothetical protein